ncbi:hypothetical protein Leryth_003764 [Lithospermum erythrorhizon]|nr:hypothetical protein Leryth_003764 [Lithospermum erythrorhizon]
MEKDSKGDVENVKATVASSIRGKDVDFDQLVFQLQSEYLLIHYSRLDFFGVSVCGLWEFGASRCLNSCLEVVKVWKLLAFSVQSIVAALSIVKGFKDLPWSLPLSLGYCSVPKEHIWIEGDNKYNTSDSRNFGLVPYGLLQGRLLWKLAASTDYTVGTTQFIRKSRKR